MPDTRWIPESKEISRKDEGFVEVLKDGKPIIRQMGRGKEILMEKADKEIPWPSAKNIQSPERAPKKRGRKKNAEHTA